MPVALQMQCIIYMDVISVHILIYNFISVHFIPQLVTFVLMEVFDFWSLEIWRPLPSNKRHLRKYSLNYVSVHLVEIDYISALIYWTIKNISVAANLIINFHVNLEPQLCLLWQCSGCVLCTATVTVCFLLFWLCACMVVIDDSGWSVLCYDSQILSWHGGYMLV